MSAALKQATEHPDLLTTVSIADARKAAKPQHCALCCLRKRCIAAAFISGSTGITSSAVRMQYDHNARLHGAGDAAGTVSVIIAGSAKVFSITDEGSERVVSFALPGDVIGLEAIGNGVYSTSATALEHTTVCVIPLALLRSACSGDPELGLRLCRAFSDDCNHTRRLLEWITCKDTDARLSCFLLQLCERFRARGFPDHCLNLSMGRSDIGSYLGIATETVSRVLGRFQKARLISVERRRICILNRRGLEAIADQQDHLPLDHREAG